MTEFFGTEEVPPTFSASASVDLVTFPAVCDRCSGGACGESHEAGAGGCDRKLFHNSRSGSFSPGTRPSVPVQ